MRQLSHLTLFRRYAEKTEKKKNYYPKKNYHTIKREKKGITPIFVKISKKDFEDVVYDVGRGLDKINARYNRLKKEHKRQ